MLSLSKSLLLISSMLEKEGKFTLAHDVESAVERIAELEAMLAYWKRTTHVEMKREVEPSLQVLNRGRVRDEGWMRKLRWSKAND